MVLLLHVCCCCQAIGAYNVEVDVDGTPKTICFLDTPGRPCRSEQGLGEVNGPDDIAPCFLLDAEGLEGA
jgi:hypothetical protein